MSLEIQLPSEHTSYEAEQAIRVLSPHIGKNATIHVQGETGDFEALKLPQEALTLLVRILAHMAHGEAVALTPIQAEITSQQAADLLNVSRPFLIKLLEEGTIPYRKIGTHRRVSLRGLLLFKQQDDAERKAIADMLTAEAQVLGLGY